MATSVKRGYIDSLNASPMSVTGLPAVPAATQYVINSILYTNRHSSSINVGAEVWIGGSASVNPTILYLRPLEPNETFSWDGVIGLEVGDLLKILSSNTSSILDVYVTYLEIT